MEFSIKMAKKEISNVVSQYLRKNENGEYLVDVKQRLPILLLGPAGIGKTQVAEEAAKEFGIGFVSYSLVHHTRQTLMGLPVITAFSHEGTEMKDTEYTLSEVIGTVYKEIESGHPEGVLLLDEANCCSETIQPMLLSFLQSKVLGSSRLPEGWIIMLCGNPPKSIYNKNAKRWDGALMDRVRVIDLRLDHQEYLQYVQERDFHPVVRLYLTVNTEDSYICRQQEDGEMQLVTYRTWENLSNALYDYEKMDFEVTPIMLNQYIKVDQIVKNFYEMYRYSRLDSSQYLSVSRKILEGEEDSSVLGRLKDKPVFVVYGITNLCFRQLNEQSEKLLANHDYLVDVRKNIAGDTVDIKELMENEQFSDEVKEKLYDIWCRCSSNELKKELIVMHNELVNENREAAQKCMDSMEKLLKELEQLGNNSLSRFYINSIGKSRAWIYLIENTEHPVLDNYREEMKAYA